MSGNNAEWLKTITVGAEVWWNDPDHGLSSGFYTVQRIHGEDAEPVTLDSLLTLTHSAGSETEVFGSELSPLQPEGLFPVLNGEAEIMGYAFTLEEAADVFDDELPEHVALVVVDDVALIDGSRVAKAWVLAAQPRPV